jgi:hypothetical protein
VLGSCRPKPAAKVLEAIGSLMDRDVDAGVAPTDVAKVGGSSEAE